MSTCLTHTHLHIICTHIHMYIYIYTYTHIHVCIYIYIHTYLVVCIYKHIHIYIHTYTYIVDQSCMYCILHILHQRLFHDRCAGFVSPLGGIQTNRQQHLLDSLRCAKQSQVNDVLYRRRGESRLRGKRVQEMIFYQVGKI